MDQIKVITKYLLSFIKKDWNLEDYPIKFNFSDKGKIEFEMSERFKFLPWSAQIINWPQMQGHGDTKIEAYKDLVKTFRERKDRKEIFPRPGKGLPIEFSTTERINKYSELGRDFLRKILDIDYDNVFISDESSLWDFVLEETLDVEFEKIKIVYGVDVSDTNGNLLEIFSRIGKSA